MVEVVINQNDGFVSITAVGGETSLDFDFPIYEKSHLRIIRTRAGVDIDLTRDTDYTIATDQLEVTAGGTAILLVAATAGDIYTLLLNAPESRTTDYNQAGDFFASTINRELDLQTQMIQQLRRDVDKSATLPDSSTLTSLELPAPDASKLIGWNATEDGLVNYASTDLSGTSVTAFIETLFNDATAAEAAATLAVLPLAGGALTGALSSNSAISTTSTMSAKDVITVAGNATNAGRIRLAEDTDNGTNYVEIIAPSSLGSNIAVTAPSSAGTLALTSDIPVASPLQIVSTSYATNTTLSTALPYDDTIPQNTEGDQILSQAFTPESASSTLLIEYEIYASTSGAGVQLAAALFVDSTANALSAAWQYAQAQNNPYSVRGSYSVASGNTTARTYKVRIGANSGSVYPNGSAGSTRIGGGVMACKLTITEIG